MIRLSTLENHLTSNYTATLISVQQFDSKIARRYDLEYLELFYTYIICWVGERGVSWVKVVAWTDRHNDVDRIWTRRHDGQYMLFDEYEPNTTGYIETQTNRSPEFVLKNLDNIIKEYVNV